MGVIDDGMGYQKGSDACGGSGVTALVPMRVIPCLDSMRPEPIGAVIAVVNVARHVNDHVGLATGGIFYGECPNTISCLFAGGIVTDVLVIHVDLEIDRLVVGNQGLESGGIVKVQGGPNGEVKNSYVSMLIASPARLVVATSGLVSSAPGLVPSAARLVIYGNGLHDGWVVEVAPLVKQGDVDLTHPIGLSAEEIIYIRDPGNLCASVRTAVTRETRVDSVCPSGGLVSTAV